MKNVEPKKSIKNLENQKVDSDKIQGGLSVAKPISQTKNEVAGVDSNQQNTTVASGFTSNVHSDGSILSKRGIKAPKNNT